jgi:hypothetical protein
MLLNHIIRNNHNNPIPGTNFCASQLFHRCDKYLRETTWKEEWFILAHSFRGFTTITGSVVSGRMKRQRVCDGAKFLTSWQPGSTSIQERKKATYSHKTHPQWPTSCS